MANNIEIGIHKTLVAKFREGGLTAAEATAKASSLASAALTVFNTAIAQSGGMAEVAHDEAFAALSAWAKTQL